MSKSWKRLRREAYPPIADQLDALWKIDAARAGGKSPPAEALAVRDAISAVKAAHPKPAGR